MADGRASRQNALTQPARKEDSMAFHEMAGAACRALTARKDGPSLYDVCDPLLLNGAGGDDHLAQFYRTALANPALRPLLRRTRAMLGTLAGYETYAAMAASDTRTPVP